MTHHLSNLPVPSPRVLAALADRVWPPERPFMVGEALDLGLDRHLLCDLVAVGALVRPTRRVYVDATLPDSLDLRAAIVRLVLPPDTFLTDRVAAWVLGATMALAPGDHLVVPPLTVFCLPTRTRMRRAIASGGERGVLARDLCEVRGLVLTTPLRTALDLGRLQQRDLAMAGMDSLAREGLYDPADLIPELVRFRRYRGVRQLRALVPLVDPGSASFGESALKLRWCDAGLPRARTQVPVLRPDGARYYIDLGHEGTLTGAEYDGEEWHGPEQVEHDHSRRLWLRRDAGWALEVFTRDRVFGPHQDATEALQQLWHERNGSRM
jgi:hypothetical protein